MAKNNGVVGNLAWKFAERISAQLVTTVVSIVLARLLLPSDYGTITLVTSFITIANVFVSDGFGSALIQKKDADALDFSSVLYFNISFSVLIYLILFFAAPYIAAFFGEGYEVLSPVLRVLGLRIILSAINSVQQAYVSKKMIFRKFFYATLIGTIVSAVVGLWMAYTGFGVWALVAQYLTNTTMGTIFLAISLKKKILLKFSFHRLKQLLGFGSRILGLNLLITCYGELRAILIGKFYTTDDLALYKKGDQFPSLLISNINTSISSVLFPRFAQIQDDVQKVKEVAKKSIRLSFYIVAPLLIGLAAVSDNFVIVFLTEKWKGCIPFIKLFCLNSLFYTVHSTNMQVIKAMGRSDISLKLEIVKKVIEIAFLIVVVRFGVIWIASAMVITSTMFTYLNCVPTKKLINYSFFEQMKDILHTFIMVAIMFVVVRCVGLLSLNNGLILIIQVVVGAATYIILSALSKNREFAEIKNLLLNMLKVRRNKSVE